MRTMIRFRRLLLVGLCALVASSCVRRLPDASAGDVPTLRAQLQSRPDDATLQTRLGIALFKAGQNEDAIATLGPVVQAVDASAAAYLYLGLANEELENWAAARAAYAGFIDTGREDPLSDQVAGRLQLVVRRELQEQARATVAQEAQISQQPPTVRSVAVFPFRLTAANEELEPLEVALADMMITDLGMSGALTVLERTQIQSLLDEMALNEAGFTDAAVGTRAGRMLRSEHVVQGALTPIGQQISFDASVINSQRGSAAGNVAQQQQIEALFDMEKAIVFEVFAILGVELTPAEREAINENRAENLLAFLAYGRGLQALDRGDFAAAAQFFTQAVQLDPGFDAARTQSQQAGQLSSAAGTSTDDVAQSASGAVAGGVTAPPDLPPPPPDVGQTLANVDQGVNPTPTSATIDLGASTGGDTSAATQQNQSRDPVQESSGSDDITTTSTAKIIIQIRRPGTEH
jgi:tetratricopeptide (TPR) repeat protein